MHSGISALLVNSRYMQYIDGCDAVKMDRNLHEFGRGNFRINLSEIIFNLLLSCQVRWLFCGSADLANFMLEKYVFPKIVVLSTNGTQGSELFWHSSKSTPTLNV